MRFRAKIIAILAGVSSIATLTVGTVSADAATAAGCDTVGNQVRQFRGRTFALVVCPVPPGVPGGVWYYGLLYSNSSRYGDVIQLAYVRSLLHQGLRWRVHARRPRDGAGAHTPNYYGNPGELQACIIVDDSQFACTWP